MDSVVLKEYSITKLEYKLIKYKTKRKLKKNKFSFDKRMFITFSVLIAALFLGLSAKLFSNYNLALFENESVYFENTKICRCDISGLTENQAYTKVKPMLDENISKESLTFTIDNKSYEIPLSDLNINHDLSNTLNQIMQDQQSGNFIDRLKKQTEAQNEEQNYTVSLVYSQEDIKQFLVEFAEPLSIPPIEPKFIFNENAKSEDEYITWNESIDGYEIDIDSFLNTVITSLETGNYDIGKLELNVLTSKNTKSDVENSIVKISEFTTDVLWSKDGRENKLYNMNLLAEKLNGNVIEVGENWSLNEIAGERNEENGWVLAPAIWSGAMTEEYGGGICQVATTVYNAMLLAEVDIVERHAHSSPSAYVDIGMDATVDYGVKDLVVQNNLDGHIYLVVKCDQENKTVTAMLFGPNPQHDYQVVVRSTLSQSDIQPDQEPERIAVSDGYAPDGYYIEPGQSYTYIRPKSGSRYKTYIYYYDKNYNEEEDSPYCWIGYEKGDNYSGEKHEVLFVDKYTGEDTKSIMTYYPPQRGRYYYNPN